MDKGIRVGARNCFVEQNEKRRRGEFGNDKKANTRFRKHVIGFLMEQYACTLAAASTHYNEAFQLVKDATPELVSGLGRPEEKNNGGRKKKVAVGTDRDALLANMLKATGKTGGEAAVESNDDIIDAAMGAAAGSIPDTAVAVDVPNDSDIAAEPKLYTVRKASDGTVIAEGVALEIAEQLVAKAVAGKKAKLVYA